MTTATAKLLEDLKAKQEFLKGQCTMIGPSLLEPIMAGQAASLCLRIACLPVISAVEAIEFADCISGGPWTHELRTKIASAVAQQVDGTQLVGAPTRKRLNQKWLRFSAFLRQSDVDLFRDDSIQLRSKVLHGAKICIEIECDCPTEPTKGQVLATICSLSGEQPTADAYYGHIKDLTAALKERRDKFKHLKVWEHIVEYPDMPDGLPALLKTKFYANEAPAQLVDALVSYDARPLRKSHKEVNCPGTQQLQQHQVAAMMMHFMQQQQQQQLQQQPSGLQLRFLQPPKQKLALGYEPPAQPAPSAPPVDAIVPTVVPAPLVSASPFVIPGLAPFDPTTQDKIMNDAMAGRTGDKSASGKGKGKDNARGAVAKGKDKVKCTAGKGTIKGKGKGKVKCTVGKAKVKVIVGKGKIKGTDKGQVKCTVGKAKGGCGGGGGGGGGGDNMPSAAARLKRMPTGCSKCRYKPGCTISCWRGRGWVEV